MPEDPRWLTEQAAASQTDLDRGLVDLDESALAAPSDLPSWTRAHVLAHLVGNATAMAEMVEGYVAGREVTQYGGSEQRRTTEIQLWRALPCAELIERVAGSGARCLAAYRAVTNWDGTLRWLSGRRPAARGPLSRWREIEIHRVDLALGYTPAHWSAEFVACQLARELPRLAGRAPGLRPPDLRPDELLAWLFGRGGADLPALPSWG